MQWLRTCTIVIGEARTFCAAWVLCRLSHALRQPTRLGTARPVSTPLSVKIVKKVGGLKAEPPKRVRNRDVIHVTGKTSILYGFILCSTNSSSIS